MNRRPFILANLSLMFSIPGRVVAWTLLMLVALVTPDATLCADGEAHAQPTRTAKERLGSKASDEQRVDNCKLPVDLRGPKSRPNECGDDASTEFVSCAPSDAQSVAVFNFELIDTSLEGAMRGARADEQERLASLSDQLRQLLRDSCQFFARRSRANRTRGTGKQPASLRWLRYAVGPTYRSQTRDHRHRAKDIESDPQHEHLRSRCIVGSNHRSHERGHARQYRRVVDTRAQLVGSQSASRGWLWSPALSDRVRAHGRCATPRDESTLMDPGVRELVCSRRSSRSVAVLRRRTVTSCSSLCLVPSA